MTRQEREEKRASLQARLTIDTTSLDRELVQQADLFYRAAEQYGLAVSRRDAAKNRLKEESARLQQKFRAVALKTGEKITEAAVVAKVENAEETRDLRAQIISAAKEVDLWEALKEAFDQRSWMLRSLCSMEIAEFNTKNSVSGGTANQIQELRYEQRKRGINEKRKRDA